MPKVCLYFELHQPYRLAPYSVFDVGNTSQYFANKNQDKNKEVFVKVALKSYIPMLSLLLKLTKKHDQFVFSFSCSGIFLEQAEQYAPEVITLLQKLVKTGQVEVLAETYYHSLASLYSEKEFIEQVKKHQNKMRDVFAYSPKVFRNTELIYSDQIASIVTTMKFSGMLTEAVDRYLHGEPRTQVFATNTTKKIPLLLKHAQLSDDIAFRFSDKSWVSYPLSADTYVDWLNQYHQHEVINLFMDFETFGEHQWQDTGIFNFFEHFVEKFLRCSWNQFVRPIDMVEDAEVETLVPYKVAQPISWADIDRDISAWRDNDLQSDTLRIIYDLEPKIKATKNKQLIEDWRRLQTSDHFYYMCIKWSQDGDVHAYFSPYEGPFEAYVRYATVLADLNGRINKLLM